MRRKREERQKEKEKELAAKAERQAQEAAEELDKVLDKIVTEQTLSNKERKIHTKFLAQQEEAAATSVVQRELAAMGVDALRIAESLNGFSVTTVDVTAQQTGTVDIRLERFSVSAGSTYLFDDASLTLAKGQRYGLLGPNGQVIIVKIHLATKFTK